MATNYSIIRQPGGAYSFTAPGVATTIGGYTYQIPEGSSAFLQPLLDRYGFSGILEAASQYRYLVDPLRYYDAENNALKLSALTQAGRVPSEHYLDLNATRDLIFRVKMANFEASGGIEALRNFSTTGTTIGGGDSYSFSVKPGASYGNLGLVIGATGGISGRQVGSGIAATIGLAGKDPYSAMANQDVFFGTQTSRVSVPTGGGYQAPDPAIAPFFNFIDTKYGISAPSVASVSSNRSGLLPNEIRVNTPASVTATPVYNKNAPAGVNKVSWTASSYKPSSSAIVQFSSKPSSPVSNISKRYSLGSAPVASSKSYSMPASVSSFFSSKYGW